jgi:hypothetical protein
MRNYVWLVSVILLDLRIERRSHRYTQQAENIIMAFLVGSMSSGTLCPG